MFKVNINPFNHDTTIGKIVGKPQFIPRVGDSKQVFKVTVLAPRNYINHDPKTGRAYRKYDQLRASCYVSNKQAEYYKQKFLPGKWIILRGEFRSVKYRNQDGKIISAHPFNLEDVELYKVPNTDSYAISQHDQDCITAGAKGLSWMLGHPGLIRRYAPYVYYWLMAHDAFVPTKINLPKNKK